jgi:hypothetical protein
MSWVDGCRNVANSTRFGGDTRVSLQAKLRMRREGELGFGGVALATLVRPCAVGDDHRLSNAERPKSRVSHRGHLGHPPVVVVWSMAFAARGADSPHGSADVKRMASFVWPHIRPGIKLYGGFIGGTRGETHPSSATRWRTR